jgi:hypothetical protein
MSKVKNTFSRAKCYLDNQLQKEKVCDSLAKTYIVANTVATSALGTYGGYKLGEMSTVSDFTGPLVFLGLSLGMLLGPISAGCLYEAASKINDKWQHRKSKKS